MPKLKTIDELKNEIEKEKEYIEKTFKKIKKRKFINRKDKV